VGDGLDGNRTCSPNMASNYDRGVTEAEEPIQLLDYEFGPKAGDGSIGGRRSRSAQPITVS